MWGLKKDKRPKKDKKPKFAEDLTIFDPVRDKVLIGAMQGWIFLSIIIYFILIIPISIWPGILVPFGLDHVIDFLKTTIFALNYKNLTSYGLGAIAERFNTVHILTMLFWVVNSIIGLVIFWPMIRERKPYHQNKKQIKDKIIKFSMAIVFCFLGVFSWTFLAEPHSKISIDNNGLYMFIFYIGLLQASCSASLGLGSLCFEYFHFHKKEKNSTNKT